MTYYALTIKGRSFGSDRSVKPRTRHFWLDRNGSNGNPAFIEMVKKCNTMQEVETLTGELQMKNSLPSHAIEKLAGASGKPMSIVHLAFDLPACEEEVGQTSGRHIDDIVTENGVMHAKVKDCLEINSQQADLLDVYRDTLNRASEAIDGMEDIGKEVRSAIRKKAISR